MLSDERTRGKLLSSSVFPLAVLVAIVGVGGVVLATAVDDPGRTGEQGPPSTSDAVSEPDQSAGAAAIDSDGAESSDGSEDRADGTEEQQTESGAAAEGSDGDQSGTEGDEESHGDQPAEQATATEAASRSSGSSGGGSGGGGGGGSGGGGGGDTGSVETSNGDGDGNQTDGGNATASGENSSQAATVANGEGNETDGATESSPGNETSSDEDRDVQTVHAHVTCENDTPLIYSPNPYPVDVTVQGPDRTQNYTIDPSYTVGGPSWGPSYDSPSMPPGEYRVSATGPDGETIPVNNQSTYTTTVKECPSTTFSTTCVDRDTTQVSLRVDNLTGRHARPVQVRVDSPNEDARRAFRLEPDADTLRTTINVSDTARARVEARLVNSTLNDGWNGPSPSTRPLGDANVEAGACDDAPPPDEGDDEREIQSVTARVTCENSAPLIYSPNPYPVDVTFEGPDRTENYTIDPSYTVGGPSWGPSHTDPSMPPGEYRISAVGPDGETIPVNNQSTYTTTVKECPSTTFSTTCVDRDTTQVSLRVDNLTGRHARPVQVRVDSPNEDARRAFRLEPDADTLRTTINVSDTARARVEARLVNSTLNDGWNGPSPSTRPLGDANVEAGACDDAPPPDEGDDEREIQSVTARVTCENSAPLIYSPNPYPVDVTFEGPDRTENYTIDPSYTVGGPSWGPSHTDPSMPPGEYRISAVGPDGETIPVNNQSTYTTTVKECPSASVTTACADEDTVRVRIRATNLTGRHAQPVEIEVSSPNEDAEQTVVATPDGGVLSTELTVSEVEHATVEARLRNPTLNDGSAGPERLLRHRIEQGACDEATATVEPTETETEGPSDADSTTTEPTDDDAGESGASTTESTDDDATTTTTATETGGTTASTATATDPAPTQPESPPTTGGEESTVEGEQEGTAEGEEVTPESD